MFLLTCQDDDVLLSGMRLQRRGAPGSLPLERAVGAAAVLYSLESTESGALIAAHVVTEASDYLVWLDISNAYCVAAFADAEAYFAG